MKKNRFESFKNLYKKVIGFLITLSLTTVFSEFWIRRFNGMMTRDFLGKGNIMIILIYMAITILFFRAFNAYKIGYYKSTNIIFSQVLALLCINGTMMLQIILMVGRVYSLKLIIVQIIKMTVCDVVLCLGLTFVLNRIYALLFPPYHMLEIYGDHKNNLRGKIGMRTDKYVLESSIHISKPMDEIKQKMLKYDAVLLNDVPSGLKKTILKFCFENSVRVYFTPKITDIIVKGTQEINLFDSPLFLCKNMGLSIEQKVVKRCMDLVISFVGLVVMLPVMLITAVCIKIEDGGPVFFKQKRCTYQNRVFWIYKFRSMIVDAEKEGRSVPAADGDSRITKTGKFIRKTRIDELPQLMNILKGDMSIVGPRPERVEHVEKYSKEIPEFSYRLKVKGGLTGYAQVYGRYNTTAYDKLKMDMIYIVNYSFLMDIQILFETVKILFQKDSTQGFTEEQLKSACSGEDIKNES